MKINQSLVRTAGPSSRATLLPDHCAGLFAKQIERAALLAGALGATVVLATGCSSTGTGFDARLINSIPSNQQVANSETTIGTNHRGVLNLILISLAVKRMLKRFNKNAVIAEKGGIFNIMYSLGFLIVELETARRRLLYVFGAPDGTPTSGLCTQPAPERPGGRTGL